MKPSYILFIKIIMKCFYTLRPAIYIKFSVVYLLYTLTIHFLLVKFLKYFQIWIIPAVYGLLKMLSLSTSHKQYWIAWLYGFSLILLFFVSTTFHISSLISGNDRYLLFFNSIYNT